MKTELKKAIIEKIFENINDFQLLNNAIDSFKNYIYDDKGEYLIGGEEVAEFVKQEIDLIK
jgi:hypothetical protein